MDVVVGMAVVVAVVMALALLDAAVIHRMDNNPLPQVGIDALDRFSKDATAGNSTLVDFLVVYDANGGDLMHLTLCVQGVAMGCIR